MFRVRQSNTRKLLTVTLPFLLLIAVVTFLKQSDIIEGMRLHKEYQMDAFQRERTFYFTHNSKYKMPKYKYKTIKQVANDGNDGVQDLKKTIRHYNLNYLTLRDIAGANHVIILSVIENFNEMYWDNLINLTFPRDHIHLAFIVPRNENGNVALQQLERKVRDFQTNNDDIYKKITILRANDEPTYNIESNDLSNEIERRKYFAGVKNELLFSSLGPETKWILWLNSNIVETPNTLVDDLIALDKPVVAANIYNRTNNRVSSFEDSKNWISNEYWLELQDVLPENEIVLEGYIELRTQRAKLNDYKNKDGSKFKEIELDSVSSGCLMVKSEVHRDGSMFPNFPFYNLVDSEAFGKMTQRLNYKLFGLPNYIVYNE